LNKDWHLITQNDDYLEVSKKRLNEPPLIWVNQFTNIINSNFRKFELITLNDIGCNVGHFARNISKLNPRVKYRGIDISETYLKIAQSNFPKLSFYNFDFSLHNLDQKNFKCDVSVISATLEHISEYENFLKNIFSTTGKLVIIRTFIGSTSKKNYCLKKNAHNPYLIRQFKLSDLINKDFNKSWKYELNKDLATSGVWKNVCNSIRRKQIVIIFKK
jgi:2-polyprenyl-3-methyl-5-hydroxy-6-metoxy-1,4-benzoquinol methylase